MASLKHQKLLGEDGHPAPAAADHYCLPITHAMRHRGPNLAPKPDLHCCYHTSFIRELMMPAFTPEAISRSLPQLELVVSESLGRWEAAGEPVRAVDSFKALTFDFIMRVSPGAGAGAEAGTGWGLIQSHNVGADAAVTCCWWSRSRQGSIP
jgi:hypothetical protein